MKIEHAWKFVALWLLASLSYAPIAEAQTVTGKAVRVTVTWTAVGAGAGFGMGLWAGLTAFDDSINSDRKVWASAVVGAGIGALGGYLISKAARSDARPVTRPRTSPFAARCVSR